ncbi:XerD Site-specific recombinase XerD [uncultured Caudovirales phage]|uniref:Integrase n=1 Tax=uncultured Caudovirales phage TaxID=2100421 RepID=A0A6J5SDZ4_9CAUD|nr:XerD Site-specific recombinase XerD [uncultured Caudovirales phage]
MSIKTHPTKAGWWYIIISHGRKGSKNYRPTEYIPYQGTEAQALAFERELRGIEPENNGRIKVIDLLDRFFTWHITMYPKTHDLCLLAFKKLIPYLGNKYIQYIRNSDYEPYKAARLATEIIPKQRMHRTDRKNDTNAETDEQYAARCIVETRTVCKRTIQIELNYFRTFLRWCKDEEKYPVGDFPKGFPKSQQKAKGKVVLSLSEIPELIEKQKEGFQRTLTMLMLQNGLRKTEALTLRKQNIDLKNNALIITGKFDKTRVVPIITQDLHNILKETIKDKKPTDYLFINPRTNRPYTDIKKSLKSAAVAAGIDKRVYNHLMRHSFVTSAIMAGVPVAAVRELAGHEDIRTTQDYTKLMAEYLQTEAVKISSVISGTKPEAKPA